MNKRTLVLGLGLLVMLVFATTATAAHAEREHGHGAVYTLTNSPLGNAVAVFERSADGTLVPAGLVPTGGAGTGSNLGSQGAVVLSDDQLYAVNAGSNTISFFSVSRDGLHLEGTVPSGGIRPISVTVHEGVLYVLNAGGTGNITGFSTDDERLTPIAGSTQPLGAGSAGPAQERRRSARRIGWARCELTLDARGRHAPAPHQLPSRGPIVSPKPLSWSQ